jgi:hypothetical protein
LYFFEPNQYFDCFFYISELHRKFFIRYHNSNKKSTLKNEYAIIYGKRDYNIVDFICENNLMYNNTEEIETLWKLETNE